jgi:hypothetical protein
MAGLIEPEMRTYLAGAGTSATNFYLQVAPGSAVFPYGTITKINPGKGYTHNDHGTNSLFETRMQCSCYAKGYQQAKTLADEVIEEMEAWADVENNVQAVFLTGEVDLYEDESKVHHIAVDFIIWNIF